MVKNPPAREVGSIPGWSGRSLGEGHGNPLQYSCLENPMDRGAWWATVHGVAKSQTRLKQFSLHARPPSSRSGVTVVGCNQQLKKKAGHTEKNRLECNALSKDDVTDL